MLQYGAEPVAGRQFKALGHQTHAIEEESDAAK